MLTKRHLIILASLLTGISTAAAAPATRPIGPDATYSLDPAPAPIAGAAATPSATRYGLFNGLDHRSQYGIGVFPEPFLVDDSDLEVNEFRLDWIHQEKRHIVADELTAEIEKGFGLLTIEVEAHYERATFSDFGFTDREAGIGNVGVAARYPLYQFVSREGMIDNTVGVSLEIGIPTNSRVSKNTELAPRLFDDLRIGQHFTLQTVLGYSRLYGSGDAGGEQSLEYGLVFGWRVPHRELPLPGVEDWIPMFELAGERTLNHGAGENNIVGNLAMRFNLKSIGPVQPRLGIGYVFPMTAAAREESRWGVVVSLVFDF